MDKERFWTWNKFSLQEISLMAKWIVLIVL